MVSQTGICCAQFVFVQSQDKVSASFDVLCGPKKWHHFLVHQFYLVPVSSSLCLGVKVTCE